MAVKKAKVDGEAIKRKVMSGIELVEDETGKSRFTAPIYEGVPGHVIDKLTPIIQQYEKTFVIDVPPIVRQFNEMPEGEEKDAFRRAHGTMVSEWNADVINRTVILRTSEGALTADQLQARQSYLRETIKVIIDRSRLPEEKRHLIDDNAFWALQDFTRVKDVVARFRKRLV